MTWILIFRMSLNWSNRDILILYLWNRNTTFNPCDSSGYKSLKELKDDILSKINKQLKEMTNKHQRDLQKINLDKSRLIEIEVMNDSIDKLETKVK